MENKILIKDICSYGEKSSIKAGEADKAGQYMFFTSSEDESKRYNKYQFDGEAIIMGTGGKATLHYYSGKFSVSTDCLVLFTNGKVKCKYLYYFLKSKMYILEAGFKGAGLKHTSKKYIENIVVDFVPSLIEQEKVVYIFDKISKVLINRKKQLNKLDTLVKARFVEMFGDSKNQMRLLDLCSIITDGTHQPPKFQNEGIPFIFVSNLANNVVTYDAEKFISDETYEELYKRTPIEVGDILLTTVGSYGHPAVVTENKKFLFQRHIAYLKPKKEMINSFYLHGALLAPDGQQQIEERVKGIAQKTLNLSEIRQIVVPVPNMESQKIYENFVHQVDKLRVVIEYVYEDLNKLIKRKEKFYEE